MRVVVLGTAGQVGRALSALLPSAMTLRRDELDISDAHAVAGHEWSQYQVIINAAAYTSVDAAETEQGRVTAWKTNAAAVGHVAKAANQHGATLVHISSEYVFDGGAVAPIDEHAPLAPLSSYGASKAAGDIAAALATCHYIVRTTWVIGDGPNFVRTMLSLAARGIRPSVVADQVGRPTFADDLANGILALVASGAPFGTYNITNTGEPASWADVARTAFDLAGYSPDAVTDTTTTDYFADKPGAATRPLNSVLDLEKARVAGVQLPPWRDSLATYVKKETSV
jgi:dTDP-4-dehydrorhamnose 3,5-epimerase